MSCLTFKIETNGYNEKEVKIIKHIKYIKFNNFYDISKTFVNFSLLFFGRFVFILKFSCKERKAMDIFIYIILFLLLLFSLNISGKLDISLKDLLWIKIFYLTSSIIPPSI